MPGCGPGSARGTAATADHRFSRVAETLEQHYNELRCAPRATRKAPLPPTEIMADLHMHTSHSHDCATGVAAGGSLHREGMGAIAVTDHNEVSGALEAASVAPGKPLTVIVGEEVMTSQGEVIGLFLTRRSSAA